MSSDFSTPPSSFKKPDNRCLKTASRLLKLRDRSRTEIEKLLLQRGFGTEEVRETLRRLEEAGLLDDERAARFWIDKGRRAGHGTLRLRETLAQRDIPEPLIAKALGGDERRDEVARARTVLERQSRRMGKLSPAVRARRLAAHLTRRGFSAECIEQLLERFNTEPTESE
ncbi:MAG TPA: regulatory protein RecX [Elusimicrobiota bacterium]|nr:regulatory protein RecX [Elusimicrobiota bacterium]